MLGCLAVATGRADWISQDIGTVAAGGSGSAPSTTATLSGSGADIWGSADSCHLLVQQYTSNITMTARITGMTDTNGWAKAGLMIRESLDANSPNVFLAATPEWHGITAQQRTTAGGTTTSIAGPAVTPTYWLRLVRSGATITAATSADGTTWSTVATFNTTFGAAPYYGFAVTSHNDGALCTASFDNFSLAPEPSPTPAAPTNFTATTVSWTQIALSWRAADSLASYYVIERSTDGVNFAFVAGPSAGTTSYTDGNLAASTTYYYRIRSDSMAGPRSAYSDIASATTNPLPASQSADIGTATAGQTTVSGNSVTLTGSGRDIWNTADGFHYYYQTTTVGDCEMIARVASVQDTNGWAKAGIMLRDSLDPGARQAWVCVSAEHGTAFQWRATTGGDTQSSPPSEDGTAPRWLKLVFKAAPGDVPVPPRVDGYVSTNGVDWTAAGGLYGPYDVARWQYLGLAVTSHNDGVLCTAQFDNVRLITPAPAPTGLQVTHRGPGGEIDLAWTYTTSDVDRFEIQANPEKAGNHDWRTLATVPGGSRQASVYNIDSTDGEIIRIAAYRDFVQSPWSSFGIVRSTSTPSLSVMGTTSSSISLRVIEQFGYSGPQAGPWSIERSNDGVNFVQIAGGLGPTDGGGTSVWADYTDSGLPAGVTRYYRARQLLTNGDTSGYSRVVNASTLTSPGSSPAVPTDLGFTSISSSAIQLRWVDNANDETGFEVQRSTDGVNFGVTYGGLAANTTTMTDTAVAPSTTYYYRVRAINGSGASPYSNVASARTPASSSPPPSGTWQSGDVGTVAMSGSDSTSGSAVTIVGGGADIWGASDSFRFRYQALSGDGAISARVVSMTDTDGWAKAGVMIRNSTAAAARNVFAYTTPEWHGIVAQVRSADGGSTSSAAGPAVNAPYWLKLTRAGTTFTAQASVDGTAWTTFATFNVTMDTNVVIGLAVTSHNQSALCTATFDNVVITGGSSSGTPPAAPVTLSANPLSSSQMELTWYPGGTTQTGFRLDRATASSGPFQPVAALAADAQRYLDTPLAAGTTYYYRLAATNGGGDSQFSNSASNTVPMTNGPTPAPTLTVTATSPTTAALQWGAGSGQFTWQVERSLDGIHYSLVYETPSTQSSLSDSSLQPSTRYAYRMRSHDSGGWSPYSSTITITTPANTSSAWSFGDIGTVGVAGSNSAAGGTITINGSGADIWGTADGCYFVWKPWTGDGLVEARVSSMGSTNGWAKAGVMIRETTGAGARNVFVALTPTWHGIVAQARNNVGDVTTQTAGPGANAPYWVRLARSGNTFTGSTSADGVTWTTFATFNVTMSASANFGFAVTSHDNAQLNQAVFEDPFVGTR